MKKLLTLIGGLLWMASLHAQELPGVALLAITPEKGYTALTFSSETAFIAGGNRYVLHVGDKVFAKSLHPDGDLSLLTLYIPQDEWNALPANSQAVLVYGWYRENDSEKDREQNGMSGLYSIVGSVKQ